jgi:hypothetical protein
MNDDMQDRLKQEILDLIMELEYCVDQLEDDDYEEAMAELAGQAGTISNLLEVYKS